jgi:hypothetical protein
MRRSAEQPERRSESRHWCGVYTFLLLLAHPISAQAARIEGEEVTIVNTIATVMTLLMFSIPVTFVMAIVRKFRPPTRPDKWSANKLFVITAIEFVLWVISLGIFMRLS